MRLYKSLQDKIINHLLYREGVLSIPNNDERDHQV